MERQVLTTIAAQLRIDSAAVIRKAEEYMRLTDIRAISSNLAALQPNGSCKAAMCLELATTACGLHIERADVVRVSGMNKKMYASSMKALECLLDLQPKASLADLVIQYGCTNAKGLAILIVKSYESEQSGDTAAFSKALFNSAALYTACRKLKTKVDKKKLVEGSGVKRPTFERLVAQMDKHADKILAAQQVSKKTKRTKSFLEDLDNLADEITENEGKRIKHMDDMQPEDDYEEWRDRILTEAYRSLGKIYTKSAR